MCSAVKKSPDIEDVYELTPLQEGMLFHTLRDTKLGMFVNVAIFSMYGVDVDAWKYAWQGLIQRHTVLRSSFHWNGLERPEQHVHRTVEIPFEEHDWRERPVEEQHSAIRTMAQQSIRYGFDLNHAPLMRIVMVRRTDNEWSCVFSHHHLVLDGWSGGLIMQDVWKLYNAKRFEEPARLHPAKPFKQYIDWLRERDVDATEAFWRRQLGDISHSSSLPMELQSNAKKRMRVRFETHSITLDADTSTALYTLARKCHVTISTLVQMTWGYLLARSSGSSNAVFGLLVMGRPPSIEDADGIVGMFLNTVPFRITVKDDISIKQWLQEIKLQQVELQEYEYVSLITAQQYSQVPHGVPLFESCVVEKLTDRSSQHGQSHQTADRHAFKAATQQNYPLLLEYTPANEIELKLNYDARRFSHQGIARVLEQLRNIYETLLEDENQPVGSLRLMSELERNLVLREWNQTQVSYDNSMCLHQLFERQASITPDKPALYFKDDRITFAELNHEANQLAHQLRGKGIEAKARIGLSIDRSIPMIAAMLAVMKAGYVYVPLDPNYPQSRLKYMLENAEVSLLITQEHLLGRFGELDCESICYDRDKLSWQGQPDSNPENVTDAMDLAYVLFTSGSTGTPKGVEARHRGAVNRLSWMWRTYPFTQNEVCCQKTTLSFVDSIWEIFGPLLKGIPLVLIPDEVLKMPQKLIRVLAQHSVSRIVLVPSLLNAILESGAAITTEIPKLRFWITSGEVLSMALVNTFNEKLPGRTLLNLYGSSEVAADATYYDTSQLSEFATAVPIGRPIDNTEVYILDDLLKPVCIGMVGELYVGGDGLARGYYGRPDLTAERFLPNPFYDLHDEVIYKTGDLARYLPDGTIEYFGRSDFQVKIRGVRIELGEIENALSGHQAIQQAIVTAINSEQLLAYVVWKNDPVEDHDEIRRFLNKTLLEYMIPSFFMSLEALPLLPNGKVDRTSLPTFDLNQQLNAGDGETYEEPKSDTEKAIALVWAKVLGVDQVGRNSDFFELGGHSLSAIRVCARLKNILGRDVPIRGLFESPTLAGLAEWLDSGKAGEDVPELVQVENRGKEAPLTYTQQRLWFVDQLNPGIGSYTLPNAQGLTGQLDLDALEQAYIDLQERHEVLRTNFISRGGTPIQFIKPVPEHFPIDHIDLTDLPLPEKEREATVATRNNGRKIWDLENGSVIHAQVISLNPTQHILNTAIHHIVADGRSKDILSRDLSAFYYARLDGKKAELEPLTLQYADFAIWERDALRGDTFTKRLEYWKKTLDGANPLEIPTDFPRPAEHHFRGSKIFFEIPVASAVALRAVAKQQNATPYMCLLAVFQLLLMRYSGEEDVIVGSPVTTRTRTELELLIGLFVNTLPLRTDLSGDPNFREVLDRVKNTCNGAFANMDLPMEEMVRHIKSGRDLSRQGSPLFQIMYVHNQGTRNMGEVSPEKKEQDIGFANFDIVLAATDIPDGGFHVTCVYDMDIFTAATIHRLTDHMKLLVDALVAQPDAPISRISFLSDHERQLLLYDWNGQVAEPLEKRCIHRVFSERAAEIPHHNALIFHDQTLTYTQLNKRANHLAHQLSEMGIGPESIVGLCFQPGIELVVGVLGILKSGAAFVTLDPGFPRGRLHYMLDDSHCPIVLTHADYEDLFLDASASVLMYDSESEEIAEGPEFEPKSGVHSGNAAYIIYTSGSTGLPKGVVVEHKNISNIVRSQLRQLPLYENDRVLLTLSLSFGAGVGELFRVLTSGATLVLDVKDNLLPGPGLAQLLEETHITAMGTVPSALSALPSPEGRYKELRLISVGGETGSQKLFSQWGTGRTIMNGYGPTEVSSSTVRAINWDLNRRPPLGTPLENTRIYLLDSHRHLAPIGTPAEIYIGGVGVTRGYLNEPDMNAERFLPDPFVDGKDKALMYRTGDVGRWLSDGSLEFMGRMDQQVKIRGFRIELGEIENRLAENDAVSHCVVAVHENDELKRLVAYVVPKDQLQVSISDLRTFLKEKLPGYMVPGLFVIMETLPRTATGKVNRRALPEPDFDQLTQNAYVAPETPIAIKLAEIWSVLLRVDKIGVNDNFFELGGDSITTTQIVARAAEEGIKITPKIFFQHQTISELTDYLHQRDQHILRQVGDTEESQRAPGEQLNHSQSEARGSKGIRPRTKESEPFPAAE